MGEEEMTNLESNENSSLYEQEALKKKATAYEKKRVLRITQNKARLEALGLPRIANSLMDSGRKAKQKRMVDNENEDPDYEPTSDDDHVNDSSDSGYEPESDNDFECQKEFEKMDVGEDVGNHEEHDINMEQHVPTSQATLKKKAGRGVAKPVQPSDPMFLKFDDLDLPTGDWEKHYEQQIGQCALRIDINTCKWAQVDQEKKDILWAETQKLFHIDDPKGQRKKNFLRALGARFQHHKSSLVGRFIEKKYVTDEGDPNDNRQPWEVYQGYFTEDQWKTFVAYVKSEEFQEPKKCRLAMHDEDGNLVVVAEGTAYHYGAGVQHSLSVLPDHYKVSIGTPYKEHASVVLPVPAPDNTTVLGQAKDYFVQWPVSMVLFEDKMEIASQSKERVASCNPIHTEESAAGLNNHSRRVGPIEDELTGECSLLHMLMTEEEHDTIHVPLKAPLFYF